MLTYGYVIMLTPKGLRGRCLRLNPTMGSDWKINSCSQIMLTNVLNRIGHTIMVHPDSLLCILRPNG